MNIEVRALCPERTEDFLSFFDNAAFTDNPDWSGCYCSFFYFCDEEFENRTGADNREFAKQAIKEADMNGYLAYADNKPVGWINADSKKSYKRLPKTQADEKVYSVVCFTIAPGYRRQGIAGMLLSAAIEGAQKKGYTCVEAYPVKDAKTDAHNYHGPLELYKRTGFEIVSETEDAWVIRKSL